jgi:hypothetical protein
MNQFRRFASLFGRRGVLAAAVGALIVLGTQVVQQLLSTALYAGMALTQGNDQTYLTQLFPAYLWALVLGILPFAIGVFLCLWLLAPIAAELHIAHVITRSLLAVAAGALVVFLIQLLESLFRNYDKSAGLTFGWAQGFFTTVTSNADWAFSNALFTALSTAISLIPLTILAGVLLWVWLRAHPAKHEVVGFIDKV